MQLKLDFQHQRHKGHAHRSYGVLLGFINARTYAYHSTHHRQLKRYLTVHSSRHGLTCLTSVTVTRQQPLTVVELWAGR